MTALAEMAREADPDSLSARLRRRRFDLFLDLVADLPRPVKILDLGGRERFWEVMGFTDPAEAQITVVNLAPIEARNPLFTRLVGDATNLSEIGDQEFDIAFSNSVIEHVGGIEDQRRMANEMQRVAKSYFLQTPNYWFPLEAHVLVPGFQYLPTKAQIAIVQNFRTGRDRRRYTDPAEARERVESIKLLTRKQLLSLFPGANLYEERFAGLVKSLIVYQGF
jgi:hypothetical protein